MVDTKAVLIGALLAAGLTYGGLVGVELIVTDSEIDVPSVPLAGEATVEGTTYHLDRLGRPTVVGEVYNGHSYPVGNATVTVTYYRDGEVVGEAVGGVLGEPIAPGDAAPFDIHADTSEEVDDYNVSLTTERTTASDGEFSVDAAVADSSQNRISVSGTVRNEGRESRAAEIVVAFYDEEDNVIGVRTTRPNGDVSPGDSVPFTVTFRTVGDVPSLAQEFDDFDARAVAVDS
ncbi:FxLYD domain-containing protein [Halobellus captivus]|uniref:FxLYD domain-containing protein n=1 Tax=Halobellus captivus TaxID=2592614 RepID=UPI0011A15816|nr:FxLYD domain-containing protein [Halobellus captivus]